MFFKALAKLVIPVLAASLVLTACGGNEKESPASGSSGGGGGDLKVAAILAGSVTDADYNFLGQQALEHVKDVLGAKTAYSENVPVPDAERVMNEYIAEGYTTIWAHGSQFFDAIRKLAAANPEVNFIGEFDAKPDSPPSNLWSIDRNYAVGFYPIGALAGMLTKTGKIGYVAGLSLPFTYSEIHAIQQALTDTGSSAELTPVFTGDFNDPAKAQQITSQLLGQGADVIVGALNLGMVGAFQAVKDKPAGSVFVTATYTDKSQFDPKHYVTSLLFDFNKPMEEIVGKIKSGTRTGYYQLSFDNGLTLQTPKNIDDATAQKVQQIVDDVRSGKTTVVKDVTPVND